jgi:hypothetical protein
LPLHLLYPYTLGNTGLKISGALESERERIMYQSTT